MGLQLGHIKALDKDK